MRVLTTSVGTRTKQAASRLLQPPSVLQLHPRTYNLSGARRKHMRDGRGKWQCLLHCVVRCEEDGSWRAEAA